MNTSTAAVHSIIDNAQRAMLPNLSGLRHAPASTGAPLASIVVRPPNGGGGKPVIKTNDEHVRAVAGIVKQAKRHVLAQLARRERGTFYQQGMLYPLAEFKGDPASINATANARVGNINYRATVTVMSFQTYAGFRAQLRVQVTAKRDGSRSAWSVQPVDGYWKQLDVKPLP